MDVAVLEGYIVKLNLIDDSIHIEKLIVAKFWGEQTYLDNCNLNMKKDALFIH